MAQKPLSTSSLFMKIKSTEFVMSNSQPSLCPQERIPEYAFIGRSNVGKSSLINMLTDSKKTAKVSGTPGKTQLINHFKINKNWFLVDLPGYGYARASKKSVKEFQKIITSYFEERTQLINTFLLIDIRHSPLSIDLEFMEWLCEHQIAFSIIFTKADKLKSEAVIQRNVTNYLNVLLANNWEEAPPHFVSSATNYIGKEEILGYIDNINQNITL